MEGSCPIDTAKLQCAGLAEAVALSINAISEALLAAIASHRDAREETRARIRLEIEPVTAKVRDAAKKAKTRAARRRDASTQSDDAHSACGRRVEASAKEKHALLRLKG